MTMAQFTRYANITDADKKAIVDTYHYYRQTGCSNVGHAIACTAARAFDLSDRQWNAKIGSDAFAATLAWLVIEKEVSLSDPHFVSW